ncbi:AAA family ATPase [Klebsiella pneumoniae]|nr:AAA family ATPase [Klebsiella pneumoniae]
MNDIAQVAQANIDFIRGQILELKNNGFVMADIARETNIKESRLSQFLAGTYAGKNQPIADALAAWLDNRTVERESLPDMPEFVLTPTIQDIWSAFQYAQLTRSIAVIQGNPGLSKTTAKEEFARTRPNVWTFKVSRSCARVTGCLYEIALASGIKEPKAYRPDVLFRQVRDHLTGKKGLLIIDEADGLGYDALEELRILQEDAGIGLVLIGNHRVYERLTGNHSRDVDFARLFSRIAKRVVIETATTADVDAVADAWHLPDDVRPVIQWIGRQAGALRMVFFVLRLAMTQAMGRRVPLTRAHVLAALKELGCEYKEKKA